MINNDNIECLTIEFKSDNKVTFYRSPYDTEQDWHELVGFWSNGLKSEKNRHFYETTLDDYLNRRSWFKFSWRDRGRKVSVSDSLKYAINKLKDLEKQFNSALEFMDNEDLVDLNLDGFKRSLTPQQLYNAKCSLRINNGANFSVPGAGKTTTTFAVWNHLFQTGQVNKMLVICPIAVKDTWTIEEPREVFETPLEFQEVDSSIIKNKTELLVVNYEKLENASILEKINDWIVANNVFLVLDEVHRVKGGVRSVRWNAVKSLANSCRRVELLTGTPMPQGFDDLRNLFSLSWKNLSPSFLSDSKLRSLKPGGVFVRTTKKELNLPKNEIIKELIPASPLQNQIYSSLRNAYSGLFKMNPINQSILSRKGSAIMTLIAASTNPGLVAGKYQESAYLNLKWPPEELQGNEELMDVINSYIKKEIPPKYQRLVKLIDESSKLGKKTIVWSSFVGNLLSVNKLLYQYNPALIYGGIKKNDRKSIIDKFRNDPTCMVLITNPQTLGEGISLHKECNQAIYLDRTFNAVHYLQSLDRIHRLGLPQDAVVKIWILSTKYTIDERINARLEIKIRRMANALNDQSLIDSSDVNFDLVFDELSIDSDDEKELYEHLLNDEKAKSK
jgi:SNF2 family DNA or RNA helicase